MRDVHIAGFSMESDKVIRFRSSDGKVAAVDLLVAIGRYSRTDKAQDAMLKLIDRNDEMVKDLMSIQVDKSLTDMVSTYFGIKIFKKKIVPDTWVRGPY
jgi:pyruvate/2-oxoglutarate dehydrogenase complex dihydrolipoamide dehydrogenase (E3) component